MPDQISFNTAIGRALHLIRKSKGLGQSYVAGRLGVSQPMYSQIEHGKINISLHQFIQLSRILEVSMFLLLFIAGVPDYYTTGKDPELQSLSRLFDELKKKYAVEGDNELSFIRLLEKELNVNNLVKELIQKELHI